MGGHELRYFSQDCRVVQMPGAVDGYAANILQRQFIVNVRNIPTRVYVEVRTRESAKDLLRNTKAADVAGCFS